MKSLWRSILFMAFALGFVITAPLVVLYTAGYRYHFESGRVLKTGLLHITSIPKEADVWIDEEQQKNQTPAVVKNIFPGAHEILLKKNGYLPWRKHLAVKSNQTTFAEDIVLFADKPLQLLKQRNVFDEAVHLTSARSVYLLREASWIELWMIDEILQEQLLLRLPDIPSHTYTLEWSPTGNYLLVTQSSSTEKIFTLVDVETKKVIPVPSSESLIKIFFDAYQPEQVYLQKKNGLFSLFHLPTLSTTAFEMEAERITQWNGRFVISQSFQDQSLISFYDQETQLVSPIAYLPLGEYQFVYAPEPFLFVENDKRHVLYLIDPSSPEPILSSLKATEWQWHANQKKLVLNKGYEIEIFDAEKLETQTVTRLSEPMKHVEWYPKGNMILFSERNHIRAIETDPRDRQQATLVSDMDVQHFWMNADGSTLYLFGSQKEQKGIWVRLLQLD